MFFQAAYFQSTRPPCGIVFEGERDPLVLHCAETLRTMGFIKNPGMTADPDFFRALNDFRRTHRIPEYDFLDPVSARLLSGEELSGDELVLLAACAEAESTELDRFDYCKTAIVTAAELGVTLPQYLLPKAKDLKAPTANTVKCAVIASLLRQ